MVAEGFWLLSGKIGQKEVGVTPPPVIALVTSGFAWNMLPCQKHSPTTCRVGVKLPQTHQRVGEYSCFRSNRWLIADGWVVSGPGWLRPQIKKRLFWIMQSWSNKVHTYRKVTCLLTWCKNSHSCSFSGPGHMNSSYAGVKVSSSRGHKKDQTLLGCLYRISGGWNFCNSNPNKPSPTGGGGNHLLAGQDIVLSRTANQKVGLEEEEGEFKGGTEAH